MKDRAEKIRRLLSLVPNKGQSYLVMLERDESGNRRIVSKEPISGKGDFEIELVDSPYSPTNCEDDIPD